MATPYADHLAGADAVDVLRASLEDYRALAPGLTSARWGHRSAPGKWTTQQIVLHVAQWEMIFGMRVRGALGQPGFVVQALDQDPLMVAEERAVDGPTALAAFEAVRRMNIALGASLSPAHRAIPCRHPEHGIISVEDLLVTLAGHAVHHFKQIQSGLAAPE